MAQGRMADHQSVSGLVMQLHYICMHKHFIGLNGKEIQDTFADNYLLVNTMYLFFTNVFILGI